MKFDEIVAFAEIEKFLDTPVKHYSSGMYVRLAFAVAAHLEPEILIVDEVLAVGDAEFQKKVLGKMGDVVLNQERTIIFVSHNMAAIRTLCQRVLVLEGGRKLFDGSAVEAINKYSSETSRSGRSEWARCSDFEIKNIGITHLSASLRGQQPSLSLLCHINIHCTTTCADSFVAIDISDPLLSPIMQAIPDTKPFIHGVPGRHVVQIDISLPPLIPGVYSVDFWLGPHFSETFEYIKHAATFEVVQSPTVGRAFPHSPDHGSIVPTSRCVHHEFRPASTAYAK